MNDHKIKSLRRTWPWPFGVVRGTCACGMTCESRDRLWVAEALGDHIWAANYTRKVKHYRETKKDH